MTLTDIASPARAAAARPTATHAPRPRDPRLDFFRGIAMFIILIAHIQDNWFTLWIPARFGFSDATEIFVFCSGMASAIAFGGTFERAGWQLGTARVGYRVWQVYWAHVGLFFATAALTVWMTDLAFTSVNYWGQLNLWGLFVADDAWSVPGNLLALMTLRWVPNYFDILPMYMVVLAMMPLMIALRRLHLGLAVAASVGLWLATQVWSIGLPAEPWSERPWFFNPFGWQLVFFTGFALMAGWLPAPRVTPGRIGLAVALVALTVPVAYFRIIDASPAIQGLRADWAVLYDKTDFGILRYVHFLALAYLAWVAVGEKGRRILPGEGGGAGAALWAAILAVIMKVGQQSLAVFVASMFLARFLGMLLDVFGRSWGTMVWVNLLGMVLITAVAYGAGWIRKHPWRAGREAKGHRASA